MALTWNLAVCSLMPRRWAMRLLGSPWGEELEDFELAGRQGLGEGWRGNGSALDEGGGEGFVQHREALGSGAQGGGEAVAVGFPREGSPGSGGQGVAGIGLVGNHGDDGLTARADLLDLFESGEETEAQIPEHDVRGPWDTGGGPVAVHLDLTRDHEAVAVGQQQGQTGPRQRIVADDEYTQLLHLRSRQAEVVRIFLLPQVEK
jgi:hypothetical protein